jgi:glycosyltransferase involved in cell wall biosynthesis
MNMVEKSMFRVLWLTENYYPSRGGMAESCDRIVHSLRQSGVSIDVAHFTDRAEKLKVETKKNGRYIACPIGNDPAHAMNCLWNLVAADRSREGLTHVVAFGGVLPMLAGPVYSAWLGVPLVTLIRGNDFDVGVFTPRRKDILRDAIERAARVCVVSRDKAEKITALYPFTQPVWIANGIDLSGWQPLPSHLSRAQSWKRDQVEEGRRVLGLFGQIKQKKGGLFFLETLLRSGHASRFHMLLVGELEEEILQWLDAHACEIAYSLYPFTDRYDLLSYYPACDLVVMPSFYDGLPNVVLEAASLSVPLLASTAGGMGDVLADGRHGFLFYPGDRHQCRRAIERAAAATDEELKRLGAECRSLVAGTLTHSLEAERYIEVLLDARRRTEAVRLPEGRADRNQLDDMTRHLTGEPI